MHTRHVDGITIRALRNGDTATVSALFERLGPRSRERRFCGAKPRLSEDELRLRAVDTEHHVRGLSTTTRSRSASPESRGRGRGPRSRSQSQTSSKVEGSDHPDACSPPMRELPA